MVMTIRRHPGMTPLVLALHPGHARHAASKKTSDELPRLTSSSVMTMHHYGGCIMSRENSRGSDSSDSLGLTDVT